MNLDRCLTQIQTSSVKHNRAEYKGEGSVELTSQDILSISLNHLQKNLHQHFSVKSNNTFIKAFSVSVASAKKAKSTDKCSSWQTYHKFMMLNQAKPAIIAHKNFFLVAIKERKVKNWHQIDDIISITFSYVVNLERTFLNENTIYIVYECMNITLRNIHFCLKEDLEVCEIVAVCKKVDGCCLNIKFHILIFLS